MSPLLVELLWVKIVAKLLLFYLASLKLSIHRLHLPLHDSDTVNLETIDLGGKTIMRWLRG